MVAVVAIQTAHLRRFTDVFVVNIMRTYMGECQAGFWKSEEAIGLDHNRRRANVNNVGAGVFQNCSAMPPSQMPACYRVSARERGSPGVCTKNSPAQPVDATQALNLSAGVSNIPSRSALTLSGRQCFGMKKIDIAGIESPSRMTRRTLRLAHGCAKKPSRHWARQALALR
jgi:hypothetical protein